MSENSAGTTGSNMDGEEPSMEDILASIRKIISDDEVSDIKEVSPEVPSLGETAFDIEEAVLSSDRDFNIENAPDDDDSSTIELTNQKNNLLVDEFDADELDSLLSFDELEIPDIDPTEENILPQGQLIEDSTNLTGNSDDASVLEALELIGQTEVEDSVALNLDADDLDSGVDDASILDDLDTLMKNDLVSDDLVFSSGREPSADLLADDSEFDMSELDLSLDNDLAASEENLDLAPVLANKALAASVTKATPETDIDLVKSLMADLTDDSFFDEEADMGSLNNLSVEKSDDDEHHDISGAASDDTIDDNVHVQQVVVQDDADEAEVMDEILSLAMDDESDLEIEEDMDLSVESDSFDEVDEDDNVEEIEDLLEFEDETDAETDDNSSNVAINSLSHDDEVASTTSALQAIARRAAESANEADISNPRMSIFSQVMDKVDTGEGTEQYERGNPVDDNVFESDDIEAIEDEMSDEADDVVEQKSEPADFVSALAETDKLETLDANLLNVSKETVEMPKAIRSETILNEVTEKATVGAFAELNNIVEEKAIYEERGARIGDLVQEALRPMLKEWLDANLQGIVERAVAKEVKRISTGK